MCVSAPEPMSPSSVLVCCPTSLCSYVCTLHRWTVLANGEVASEAEEVFQEGASAQVSGTLLQRASIEVCLGGVGVLVWDVLAKQHRHLTASASSHGGS